MAVEVKLPSLGEVESGDVLEFLVSEGDTIEKEQGIVELETDKATLVVPSDAAGVVVKINFAEGDTINVGDAILTLEPAAASTGSVPSAPQPAESAPPTPTPAAETTRESAPTPSTPTPSTPTPSTPTPSTPAPSTPAPSTPTPSPAPTPQPVTSPSPAKAVAGDLSNVAAGPAVRRFAREVGVDLRNLTGTGPHERITRDDVLAVVRSGNKTNASGAASGTGKSDGYGPVRIEKMPKIRRTIARKMHESWSTVPRVTNFDDADITDLEEIRQSSKQQYAARDIKLTTMPFVIKAVAMALKAHPLINASLDLDNGKIVYKDYVNVGIAVDTDRGLVVPSLRSADTQGIPEIARQLGEMAGNVRDNNFTIEDLRGGTFTISNLGAIGGTYSTPIINIPETSILLIGRSRKMPVVVEDEIKIRLMMPLSLSYDHRLIDGGAAARFLNDVIGYLEAPSRLLLAL